MPYSLIKAKIALMAKLNVEIYRGSNPAVQNTNEAFRTRLHIE